MKSDTARAEVTPDPTSNPAFSRTWMPPPESARVSAILPKDATCPLLTVADLQAMPEPVWLIKDRMARTAKTPPHCCAGVGPRESHSLGPAPSPRRDNPLTREIPAISRADDAAPVTSAVTFPADADQLAQSAVAAVTVTGAAAERELAEPAATTVTTRPSGGTPAAERERLARKPIYFERTDWSLFLDQRTLPQKAGCQPHDLRRLVLRELVDNALDAGANVTVGVDHDGPGWWVIADDGPGLEPERVPQLFSVNRPLLSSKQIRLPTRGMVGNGLRVVMGVVSAFDGRLTVETSGRRLELAVDRDTGLTVVASDEAISLTTGLSVRINLGGHYFDYDGSLASETARIATFGSTYHGATSPYWYAAKGLRTPMQQAPPETTVADVASWFAVATDQHRDMCLAHDLDISTVSELLTRMRAHTTPVRPHQLGDIDAIAHEGTLYHKFAGVCRRDPQIPYVAEAWTTCRRAERGASSAEVRLIRNRTESASRLYATSTAERLTVKGCGPSRRIKGKTGHYNIVLSVISPLIELATDGKEPALLPFSDGIVAAIGTACARAHNQMDKPPGSMSVVEAAELVMVQAYRIASSNGTLPANARQIYYAALPFILELTGRKELPSNYFLQTILPDHIDVHPESYAWDVVRDDRAISPSCTQAVPLGWARFQCGSTWENGPHHLRPPCSILARWQLPPARRIALPMYYSWKKRASILCLRTRRSQSGLTWTRL
jgi:hypothetical protein